MMASLAIAEQRARDALAFDPFPQSPWVRVDDGLGILVAVRYSEPLSRLLRSLPGAAWQAEHRRWRYPFASADAIRDALPEIERLAALAQESADRETERREAEREANRARWAREAEQRRAARAEEAAKSRRSWSVARPRPMQMAYLTAVEGKPRLALTLEAIADNLRVWPIRMLPRNSVAQIFGSNGRGGWARAYLTGGQDYAGSNSTGSRGITVTYFLEEGPIYEICAPQSWRSTDRYFARVVDGHLCRMTREEVEACLAR